MTLPSSDRPPHTRPEHQPRVPNFKRFLITGAVLGFVIGAVISIMGDDVQGYSATSGALYIGAFGAFIGLGLAGLIGILLDRSGRDQP